ncbi:MAG: pilus assembly protein [Devosia sp.]|nr:pilus assembly protein [Devosia sp.]
MAPTNFPSLIGRRLLGLRRAQFVRDERGVTAIEFGVLALPFFMIIGAILETSVLFLSGQVLDSAVQDVSRLIRTGQAKNLGITSTAAFRARVCDRLYGLFSDCNNKLHVEVNVAGNFSSATISPPVNYTCTADCGWTRPEVFAPGQGSSIVAVQVYYKWPVLVGLGGYSLGNLADGNRLMSGSTVLRNEPFT